LDNQLTKDMLAAMDTGEINLEGSGFTNKEIENMVNQLPPIDPTPENKFGVMIDCQDEADIQRVLDKLIEINLEGRAVKV